MLRDESSLNERDGVVLWEPGIGIAYQIAGALQRLGCRMIGLTEGSSESFKAIPMQLWPLDTHSKLPKEGFTSPYSTAVFALNPKQTSFDNFQTASKLRNFLLEKQPNSQILWVLPLELVSKEDENLSSFFDKTLIPQTDFIFWTHPPFGFRDQGLIDAFLKIKNTSPALLTKIQNNSTLEISYMGDIAAFVAGWLMRNPSLKNSEKTSREICHYLIPGQDILLSEFASIFLRSFGVAESHWLEKFATKISGSALEREVPVPTKALINKTQLQNFLGSRGKVLDALEVFPTGLTHIERAFNQMARSYKRDPDLELIFPPGSNP